METCSRTKWYWQLGLVSCLGISSAFACLGNDARAQLLPDNTLGAERTVVTPLNPISDRIDGGATRGANLFQSFLEFNVGEGRGVYFSNPVGIDNILSRVTGSNPSNILGRLGVLGNANLFLLNPNGIIFGPNASLDIKGSFLATTADAIRLGEDGYFSAAEPQSSTLLSVSPGALFFNQVANQPAAITNQGTLTVGQNFALSAGNLDLQGQLYAGGNLTLQAQDTVRVRDRAASPFIASSGGELLVQGDREVDIFALNHPASGLFSGGDMVLRSANTVGGDAHYTAGGNFRIERLDGSLGNLSSPHDPIIRANGDVFLNAYEGASLHILAGGSVEIPDYVWIQGSDPANGLIDTVTLSDGTSVPINGQTEPTLDIRAGLNPDAVGTPVGLTGTGTFPGGGSLGNTPSSADIRIGTILFADPTFNFLPGRVLLTNQYQPNPALTGNIQVTATQGGFLADTALLIGNNATGGPVTLDSRGTITLNGTVDASTGIGRGGDVTLLANQDITTGTIFTNSQTLDSGAIRLISRNGAIDTTAGILASSTGLFGRNGGNITLQANGDINVFGVRSDGGIFGGSGKIDLISGGTVSVDGGFIYSDTYGTGKGGDINIVAESVSLTNDTLVDASTYGQADSGTVVINARDTVSIDGSTVSSFIGTGAVGNSGGININAGSLSVTNRAVLDSSVYGGGVGRAGDIVINTRDTVTFNGGFARSRVAGGTGDGGNIRITTGSFLLTGVPTDVADANVGQLVTATFGDGDAGDVFINASGTVVLDGRGSDIWSLVGYQNPVGGNAGNISIVAGSLSVQNGARLVALTEARGNAGEITINTGAMSMTNGGILNDTAGVGNSGKVDITTGAMSMSNSYITSSVSGQGEGADINIAARSLNLNSSTLSTAVVGNGQGNAGDLNINVEGAAIMDGGGQGNATAVISYIRPGGGNARGSAGNIKIEADSLSLQRGVEIGSGVGDTTSGGTATGDGGNISIELNNALDSSQSFITSRVFANGIGDAGNIGIQAGSVSTYQSVISASTEGRGNAGGISVRANDAISLADSDISTAVQPGAIGNAQGIDIRASAVSLTDGAQLNAITSGEGNAGDILINADERVSISGTNTTITPTNLFQTIAPNLTTAPEFVDGVSSGIFTSTNSSGVGGNITVSTDKFVVSDGAVLDARTTASGRGGTIALNTNTFEATNGGQLTAITSGSGTGGAIALNATGDVTISGSDPTYAARLAQLGSETDIYGKTKVGNQGAASGLYVNTTANSTGDGGNINVAAANFNLTEAATLSSSTAGGGNAGRISVQALDSVSLANNAQISGTVEAGATGNGNEIEIKARSLSLTNHSQLSASTAGQGNAGSVNVTTSDRVLLDRSSASSAVAATAQGDGGSVTIDTRAIELTNGALVSASTAGRGNAGSITMQADDAIAVTDSRIESVVTPEATGNGGDIDMTTGSLSLTRSQITSNSQGISDAGQTTGNAGDIRVTVDQNLRTNRGEITATSAQGGGGNITIAANDTRLGNSSLISTSVFDGTGGGGNITINSPRFVALEDSDILANAFRGAGGNIQINSEIFLADLFSSGRATAIGRNPGDFAQFRGNDRVDISASSALGISGTVSFPDFTFLQNSLASLASNFVNPDAAIASSCLARRNAEQGSFTVTGTGGLPQNPYEAMRGQYQLTQVQGLSSEQQPNASAATTHHPSSLTNTWKLGDPVIEAQGMTLTAEGRLLVGTASQLKAAKAEDLICHPSAEIP